LSDGALKILCAHSWPGNVRELQHAIERAMVFHDGDVLKAEAFGDLVAESLEVDTTAAEPAGSQGTAAPAVPTTTVEVSEAPADTESDSPTSKGFQPPPDGPADRWMDEQEQDEDLLPDWQTLADVERAHIAKTLKETFYNQSAAARMLGIDRKQLARKIKKYELQVPRRAKGHPSGV
ncbi:MAG: hypothetical protein OES79_14910, partial [Planctomycetota bacterium]|nr:hypothetical protein [Planctomycetota bacterium]